MQAACAEYKTSATTFPVPQLAGHNLERATRLLHPCSTTMRQRESKFEATAFIDIEDIVYPYACRFGDLTAMCRHPLGESS